jgi:transcriptional regulator GlxA family with amidase domain
VAVLLFNGCPLFETSVPLSVFGVDRSDTGAPVFDTRAVAAEPGPVLTTAGITLAAPRGLAAVDAAGIVIVPTWRDPAERPPAAVLSALRRAHREGAVIIGLCLGAFVLAAAGLLDGHRAATHWRYAERLAADYPAIEVDPTVLYVDAGQVITSAGTAAGLDACLHVVRREYGAAAAAAIARRMVVSPHRSGGQAQFIDNPLPRQTGAELTDVLAWAIDNLDASLDVQALSNRAHLSRRTFDRRFREVTGTSPLDWLLHQRVLEAQRLLEGSDLTVDTVASRVGFSNAVAMRPHFRRIVGVSPQSYRQTFRTR